jgi:bifunctional non-homologous end joining protein LigD
MLASPMPSLSIPPAAVRAGLPASLRLQIVTPAANPPTGDSWLHEIKHDGHRLIAVIAASGQLSLISRNGFDRTPLFRAPFRKLAATDRELVLDGEIAVPDERGVTHLDLLNDAIASRQPDRLAYFAFDLLHIDGHDLRRCPIEGRKALLRRCWPNRTASASSMSSTSLAKGDSCSRECATLALRASCRSGSAVRTTGASRAIG